LPTHLRKAEFFKQAQARKGNGDSCYTRRPQIIIAAVNLFLRQVIIKISAALLTSRSNQESWAKSRKLALHAVIH
jgi:hypothetical protein